MIARLLDVAHQLTASEWLLVGLVVLAMLAIIAWPEVFARPADAMLAWLPPDEPSETATTPAPPAPLRLAVPPTVMWAPQCCGRPDSSLDAARSIAGIKASLRAELGLPAAPDAPANPELELFLLAWLEIALEYHVGVVGIDQIQDYVDEVLAGENAEVLCGAAPARQARA